MATRHEVLLLEAIMASLPKQLRKLAAIDYYSIPILNISSYNVNINIGIDGDSLIAHIHDQQGYILCKSFGLNYEDAIANAIGYISRIYKHEKSHD